MGEIAERLSAALYGVSRTMRAHARSAVTSALAIVGLGIAACTGRGRAHVMGEASLTTRVDEHAGRARGERRVRIDGRHVDSLRREP